MTDRSVSKRLGIVFQSYTRPGLVRGHQLVDREVIYTFVILEISSEDGYSNADINSSLARVNKITIIPSRTLISISLHCIIRPCSQYQRAQI